MNNLSWLLYWADVLPRFALVVATTCAFLAMFGAAMSVLYFTAGFGCWSNDEQDYTARFRHFPVISLLALVIGLSSSLVPSKNTFYLIAESEATGQVLKTPEVTKVRAVINKWLEDAAAPSKKGSDDK